MILFKYKWLTAVSVLVLGLISLSQLSCVDNSVSSQIDSDGVPEIQNVRYTSPDSSRNVEQIGPGATVALLGKNMDATTEVYFNGIQASFNPALVTDSSLIVTVPSEMPFGNMDPDDEEINTIRVANGNGESILDFPVVPPAPQITAVSNEYAHGGENITISGQYLYLITDITFPGDVQAEQYSGNAEGTRVQVTVPENADESGGPIQVSTTAGSANSTPAAGFWTEGTMICNFDDVNNLNWGVETGEDATMFPEGWGVYAHMQAEDVPGGDWAWWNTGRSINTDSVAWVEPDQLSEPVGSFALKFEVNTNTPINQGTFMIRPSNGEWVYIARYEPWTDSGNDFSTDGWETASIPLTEFRTSQDGVDGVGDPAPNLETLLSPTGARPLGIMYVNDDSTAQSIDMAVDNIRVEKIAN